MKLDVLSDLVFLKAELDDRRYDTPENEYGEGLYAAYNYVIIQLDQLLNRHYVSPAQNSGPPPPPEHPRELRAYVKAEPGPTMKPLRQHCEICDERDFYE